MGLRRVPVARARAMPGKGALWQRRRPGRRWVGTAVDSTPPPKLLELFEIFRAAGTDPQEVVDGELSRRYAVWLAGRHAN